MSVQTGPSRPVYTHETVGGDASGIVAHNQPTVPVTLTVIGGRASGKTALMAGFFQEYSNYSSPNIYFRPITPELGTAGTTENTLNMVGNLIYSERRFPAGDVNCSSMPLELGVYTQTRSGPTAVPVARINLLDYPGGVWAGMAQLEGSPEYQVFWRRVAHSDALILVADGHELRTRRNVRDWPQVFRNFQTALRLVAETNGNQRVVPVAVAMTKCDEYRDPLSQQLDATGLENDYNNRDYHYPDLEGYWRGLAPYGRYRVFATSCITNSLPSRDERFNIEDRMLPFQMNPQGPGGIRPSGCAAPFLWTIASVLRFNITMFADLWGFLRGASGRESRVADAVRELEYLALRSEAESDLHHIRTQLEREAIR